METGDTGGIGTARKLPDDTPEETVAWVSPGKVKDDRTHRTPHPGSYLQQLLPDGPHLRPGQFSTGQKHAPELLDQHIGGGRQKQPELAREETLATGPVGK